MPNPGGTIYAIGVGPLLRAERQRLRLTARALGREIGVQHTTLRRIERGQSDPSLRLLVALADLFNVTLDYLVGRSDDPLPPRRRKRLAPAADTEDAA